MNAPVTFLPRVLTGAPVPPIALLRALPPGPLAKEHLRLQRLAELFARLDREDMEAGIELLLAEIDARDGDLDVEPNGDELDGTAAEDDFVSRSAHLGEPGCPVADAGEEDDEPEEADSRSDIAWLERVDQSRAALPRMRREQRVGHSDGQCIGTPEDIEENGDEHDTGNAEDEELTESAIYYAGHLPGCSISDAAEPTLAMPEGVSGRWGGNLTSGGTNGGECEPSEQPPTMDGPMAANDRVPA